MPRVKVGEEVYEELDARRRTGEIGVGPVIRRLLRRDRERTERDRQEVRP